MKRALFLAMSALMCAAGAIPALAGQSAPSDDWCRSENRGNDQASFCEVRESTLRSSGSLTIDASPNGGIKVEGAPRYDVRLRARVVGRAATEERARQIASAVRVQPDGDRIEAEGPGDLGRGESWNVSYEVAVPLQMSLSLSSTNGGVSVSDVEGRIEFTTTNGGVRLANVGGDVRGRTTNGGVNIELDGASWRGEGLDVQTSNGGVHLAIPDSYSAQLEVGTSNGGLNTDFPVTMLGRRNRQISATLGAGGPPIRVKTSNGGVRITKK
jgi:hypothetical protein